MVANCDFSTASSDLTIDHPSSRLNDSEQLVHTPTRDSRIRNSGCTSSLTTGGIHKVYVFTQFICPFFSRFYFFPVQFNNTIISTIISITRSFTFLHLTKNVLCLAEDVIETGKGCEIEGKQTGRVTPSYQTVSMVTRVIQFTLL